MKKLNVMLGALVLMLCVQVFAVKVGDKASYVINSQRTAWIIKDASGELSVVKRQGDGFIVHVNYRLDVRLKGEQIGTVEIFIPDAIFSDNFHNDLAKKHKMEFGAFSIEYNGKEDCADHNGKIYAGCHNEHAFDVDHKHNGQGARVISINHKGSIEYVTKFEATLKVHDGVPVIGAVQMDFSGISNNGIAFHVGLDLRP